MKFALTLFTGLFLFLSTATCDNTKNESQKDPDQMEVTGTIQQQGITSYQYGTHTLTNDDTFYALKSETVNLDNYIDKEVTIVAKKIEGYPVDGGPDYLLVLEVME